MAGPVADIRSPFKCRTPPREPAVVRTLSPGEQCRGGGGHQNHSIQVIPCT